MSTFEWLVGKAKVRLDDTFLMVLFRSVVATIVINVTAVLIWSVLAQVVEDVPKIALLGHLRFIVLFLFLSFIVSSYWVVYQRLKLVPKENITSRGFWYDDNGVLWNGNEQNIAFRIETFLGMLSGIRRNMEEDRLKDLLTEAGKKASKDFANRFVTSIYPIEIQSTYDNKYWKDLAGC